MINDSSSDECDEFLRRIRSEKSATSRSSRQSLANHPTQATEGPADIRNLIVEKQRLPGPIYPDSSAAALHPSGISCNNIPKSRTPKTALPSMDALTDF